MKKQLAALVMAALMIFGVAAFANGPLLSVSIVPTLGEPAFITAGYDFGSVNIEAWKLDMTTPYGFWEVGLLWTPELGTDGFGYRVGPTVLFDYNAVLLYQGFGFVVGASQTFGPIQLFAQFNIQPWGVALSVPVVGVNILFGDLIPDKAEL